MTNKNKQVEVTLVGYARVSTADQSAQMQIEALLKYGCLKENIYSENMSGAKKNRPALAKAMRALREGDTLVVWKLDRIARSIRNLLDILEELEEKGVAFRSITDNIETETPGGKLLIHIMGSIAEFERNIGVQRSKAGIKSAQERGVKFGAKHKLKPESMPTVWKLIHEQGKTRAFVAKKYKVSVQTIARRLGEYEKELAKPKTKPKSKKR